MERAGRDAAAVAPEPATVPDGDLTGRTLSGLSWTYGATAASVLLQLGYTAVMSRLLDPAAFGLVAMAQVFLRFGSYFAEMGIGPALVQRERLVRDDVRAAFTSSVLLGAVFALLIVAAAPLAQRLFQTADVVPVVRVLALVFVLNGLSLTSQSLLRRQLRFRALAAVSVASYAVGYLAVGILLALAGAGVWSLVAAAIGQAAVQAAVSYPLTRHAVTPLLAWQRLRGLYAFGGAVTAISFLEFLRASLDTMFVGRYAGEQALGQYNRAALLVVLPFGHLVTGLTKVLFPTFSRIQGDRERVRGVYLDAVRASAAIVLPTAAGIAVAAPEVVRVVLGNQWDAAARILPVLAFAVAIGMLTVFAGITCEALAELREKVLMQVPLTVMLGALLTVSAGGPLIGFAYAVLVTEVATHLWYASLMMRLLAVPPRRMVVAYLPATAAAAIVAASIAVTSALLRGAGIPPAITFLVQVTTGAGVLLLLWWWGPLAGIKHDVHSRLARAGLLGRGHPARAVLRGVLTVGR